VQKVYGTRTDSFFYLNCNKRYKMNLASSFSLHVIFYGFLTMIVLYQFNRLKIFFYVNNLKSRS